MIAQTLSHYRIIEKIGAGGMGEVFLAHDTKLNRKVALKLLPVEYSDNKEHTRRFEREAQAASALNQPNILTIYEIGEFENRQFIATEFIDGITLHEKLRTRESLSIHDALGIAVQAATALVAAHEAGIIHRDIKPGNIMLRRDGLVKVLDFGLAKLTQSKTEVADSEAATKALFQTAQGSIIGTAAYMSPEQARGLDVDARTDIFSLGAVIYEMLAGRLPFAGATASDCIASILKSEPAPVQTFNHEVPAELQRITTKTLAKDRAERYQTTKDLLIDLKSVQKRLEFETELERTSPASKEREAKTPTFQAAPQASIAVLPFANMSADTENEYFCDGLAEELLNALAKIEDLKVAARTSAFSFKGKNTNVSEIGNALNVKTVLEGSVRKSGNQLRITVQLVNASDGYHLWSERYDREMKDIFDTQDEITRAVMDALKVKLLGEEKLAKNYANNVEAYQLYLKGRYHFLKLRPAEIQTGISYFQQAVEIDSSYALAYAGLAQAYQTLPLAADLRATEFFPKAKAAAHKAIEIDGHLAEAHAILGWLLFWYERDWTASENECQRAFELNPNGAEAHEAYAHLLSNTGRHAEALAEIECARERDPLNLRINALEGQFLLHAGRADEALAQLQKTFELESNFWLAHLFASSVYTEKGMYTEAVAEANKAKQLSNGNSHAIALSAYALAKSGKQAEARLALEELLKLSTARYVPPYHIALIYLGLDERDKTFEWLARGLEERDPKLAFLKVEPKWNNLRADSRFKDILRRVGLPTDEFAPDKSTNESSETHTVLLAPAMTDAKDVLAKTNEIADKPALQQNRKVRPPWLLITLLSLLVAAAGFFAYRSFTLDASKQIESIAVMPFVNESGNADNEYLSDGMTETLISSLSQLPKLNVKARSSVFRYKGKDVSPQTIGKELSVQAVLLGRVIQRGELLTLSWELVNVQTENVIWSERYNSKQADLVALQSEIARDVSNKLRMRLSGADQQKLAKNYTENSEAYQLYLKGRYYWYKFPAKEFEKSRDYYQQAIDVDPNYALAYAGLAEYYGFGAATGFLPPTSENWSKSEAAANKALALDDTLPDAYNALAGVKEFNNDRAGAERELKRIIELNPNYAEGRRHYAIFLIEDGRPEEALAQMKKVLKLEPLSVPFNRVLAMTFYQTRQYDRAIEQYQKTLELDPNDPFTHELLGNAYEQKGMQKEAVAEWSRALRLTGDNESATMLERTFAASGFNAAVRALWQKELERSNEKAKRGEYVPAMNYAHVYTRLADKEQAFAWLAKAEQERNGLLRYAVKLDPIYDSLRDDPRFQDLLRRIGLPQ